MRRGRAASPAAEAAPPHGGQLPTLSAGLCVRSLGGVHVLSGDLKIKVSNSLEDRLQVAYEGNIPALREKIFGKSGGMLRV